MRINNNMMAMNTSRQMNIVGGNQAKSMEKLSSGYRINRAGDDAAGLAISEKMRAQVRGLNQASRNAQDGISLIQTAEGALTESHAILQRMRELSVQASNDTNVEVDRASLQDEISQLTSEIDRIGNTTEFNTQSLLKGDGSASLKSSEMAANLEGSIGIGAGNTKGTTTHVEATQNFDIAAALTATDGGGIDGTSLTVDINGEKITVNFEFTDDITLAANGESAVKEGSADANSVTVYVNGDAGSADAVDTNKTASAISEALNNVISNNETLEGSFGVTAAGATITMAAKTKEAGGQFYGNKGFIGAVTNVAVTAAGAATSNVGTTTHVQATKVFTVTQDTQATAKELIGTGFTIGDKQYEFYNANDGAYTGDAIGINISAGIEAADGANNDAIGQAITAQVKGDGFTVTDDGAGQVTFTATALGEDGNNSVSFSDGGIQEKFNAEFQIGANEGQTMEVAISDMRAKSLGVEGIDITTKESAKAAITTINDAIEKVSSQRSSLGAVQNRLEHTIKNLDTSAENLQAAESRIRDVDMAKEMMEFTKNNILSQAAQSMLAQANQAPQGVLQLLR